MSSLTFGRLCQMILEISRKEKLIDGWNKQVIVVNSLFQMAGIHNYYEPGACSYFINQKKEIPKGKRERLISKSLDDQAYLIAQKIRNENSQLPLQPLATSIRHFYQHPTFHEDAYYPYETAVTSPFQPDQLEQIYQAEDYPLFLAKVLLHLLIFVPNVQKRTECNLLNNKVRFNQHIQHFLDNQQYYEKFHRDLVIFPFMEEKYYKIVSDTSYSAYRINPRTPERDYFYYFFSFNNAFEQDAHQLAYLEINGIDYTDKVTSQLSLEYEREFPFVKRYMLKGIPHSDFYHVRMIWNSQLHFPVLYNTFRLPIPCKDFKVSLEIRHYEKYKFHSSFKPFGNYVLGETNTDKTPPDSAVSYFHNRDWTYPSCGYSYLVKPQDEFWLEFLPLDNEKNSVS